MSQMSFEQFAAIDAIKQIKYAYLRHVDLKQWPELAALLTDDCVGTYSDGKHSYTGRDAIMAFLEKSLGTPDVITVHLVHHPEIQLSADGKTASGVWYLEDRVINRSDADCAKHYEISGAAFYADEYRLTADGWKISATGYKRVYEQTVVGDKILRFKNRHAGHFN